METHSSILAWEIPWTEEPGRLQTMGSQTRLSDLTFYFHFSLVAQLVKNPLANAGDSSSIPGLGRSPREKSGNPLQYSCLENYMDRGGLQSMGSQRFGHN